MEIIKKYLTNGQYLTAEYVKDTIFLHHTAGLNAEGAWQWWNQTPERVGTPFIIDRDGTVIECFDPKVWAFHLGITGDDNYHEKHSISIELVAGGQLYKEGDQFRFYPLYPNNHYFTVIPKEEVFSLKQPWRGYNLYHTYTQAQLDTLKELIPYLIELFPTLVLPSLLGTFYEYDPGVVANHKPGLWSHSTVRENKNDIFPYPPLLETLEEIISNLGKVPWEPKSKLEIPPKTIKKGKKG